MKQTAQTNIIRAIPLAISLVFVGLGFTSLFQGMEKGLYDLFLRVKPQIPQAKEIVLLDVDDNAIKNVGSWPWPRNLMADGIMTLKELGARYSVFDIEYLDPSPPGIDLWYLNNGLKLDIDRSVGEVSSGIGDLFGAIESKSVRLDQAHAFTNDLIAQTDALKGTLYDTAKKVAINNDLYLGQALGFFGDAYITLNRQAEDSSQKAESEAMAAQKFAYAPVILESKRSLPYQDFLIPLPELISRAKGAGLTNVEIDLDGSRRRIALFETIKGKTYAQLATRPLLDYLGNPTVTIRDSSIHVANAIYPDGTKTDFNIPLDSKGLMLINWTHGSYDESFRHISFFELIDLRKTEQILLESLGQLGQRQAWQFLGSANPVQELVDSYQKLDGLKRQAMESGLAADRDNYLQLRAAWFSAAGDFAKAGYDAKLDALLGASLGTAKGEQKDLLILERTQVAKAFVAFSKSLASYSDRRNRLSKDLQGAICIIGWTSTGTTDFGVNPFAKLYANVGTHASVANTILQRQFLSEAPPWLPPILTVLFSIGIVFIIRNMSPVRQNIFGVGFVLVLFAVGMFIFVMTGFFIPLAGTIISIFLSYISYSLIRFFITEQDKNFLRKAFGTYLSGDVINELIENPNMLKLGGQKREMTAVFTDVRGFSTISEKLDPEQLVTLLNQYLSAMSDIVLNAGGTIDKFEGDAIIAFWGAPLDMANHAHQACLAAVRMKQMEDELNKRFMAEALSPSELKTRIGVNTGDMVVGNMGTERKMDYTMMGSNVNLAARLEGVNKFYGTWILASDATIRQTDNQFVVRALDRVRVVGIHTPVQLFEVVGLKSEVPPETIALLDRFAEARAIYESKDWKGSQKALRAILKDYPEDGPSNKFLKLATDFIAKPPAADWDGVVGLSEK